jgi:opacity protein-like surface antigen
MKRIGLVIASVAFVFASAANAQSVSGRVTGTVGEAGAGAGLSGSQAPSSSNPSNSSLLGGELPAGVKMKLGDKVINLPGNVGVGDNGGNFKAGVVLK